jgi:hypothetical protein
MKKKSHKKPRPSKRAAPHKGAQHSAHVKRAKRAKRTKRRAEHRGSETHSSPLLRAIRRRHEAERGERREPHEMREASHHPHKHGAHLPTRKRSHDAAEPVITEKSFEKMLTMRRFNHHTR